MEVRSLRRGEEDRAAALVRSIWAADPVLSMRADAIAAGRAGDVLVATDGRGVIVGVATLGRPGRGPHRAVAVDVGPEARRAGTGRALVEAVRRRADAPLGTRLRPEDDEAHAFYASLGFQVAERAVTAELDPTDRRVAGWARTVPTSTPAGAVRAPDPVDAGAAAVVLGRWYRRTHPYAPQAPFGEDEARRVFVDGSTALCGAVHDGRLVAAAAPGPDPFGRDEGLWHLAFAGAAEPSSDEHGLVRLLYACALGRAERTAARLRIEVSDRHEAGWDVVAELPVDVRPELTIMVEATD